MIPLSDVSAERGVLSGICQYGQDSYLDVADIIQSKTFTVLYNEIVYSCSKHIYEQDENATLDVASLYSAGEELGLSNIMSRSEVLEHINSLFNFPISQSNVRKFAAKIRKLEIARNLREHLKGAGDSLLDLNGNESISHILGIAEDSIFSFSSTLNDTDNEPKRIGDGLVDYIQHLGDNPIDQIGIPTGFPEYDKAIGGGLRNGTINVIGARPKALSMNNKILTPYGWKLMRKIQVGDEICSPSNPSGVTKVTAVYPQGLKEAYEFTFSDGAKTIACKEHYWSVKNRRWSNFKVLSFDEMQQISNNKSLFEEGGRPKWQFPLTKAVMLHQSSLNIDPYVLGCLLGDGGLTTNTIMFSSTDTEIIEHLNNRLPNGYFFKKKNGDNCDWRLNSSGQLNMVKIELNRLNLLGKNSHEKFIPDRYLYNSVEYRTLLLAGLLDTDGSVVNNCGIEYTTVSYRLALDVQELVRSLGGLTSIKSRSTKCNGKKFLSYRLYIRFNDISRFFLLSRKINLCTIRSKPPLKRGLIEVRSLGQIPMQCIEVAEQDGLFITDDYIVTHNCGKTTLGGCMGFRIAAEQKIPVLNMDTEMTFQDHVHKTLAMASDCFIYDIETGKFAQKPHFEKKVKDIARKIQEKDVPYDHRSIAGMPFEEQLAIMRRWIIKRVGLDSEGKANPCVIVYDYLKLMTSEGIGSNMAEFQALGFMMSSLHNFAVRYGIPILTLMQLNRDGINKEGTDVASGSDRIVWLCSNFTIFKIKSDEEIAQDGIENGNRKLVPIVCRHGAGMEDGNYINCFMKGSVAKVTEGETKFQLMKRIKENPQEIEND